MEKQTELKAKIGECQLELESLQAQAQKVVEMKNQYTQSLIQELSKPSEKPIEKSVEEVTEEPKKK